MRKKFLCSAVLCLSAMCVARTSNATIYLQGGVGTQGLSIGASYYYKNVIGIRGVFDYIPGKPVDSGLNSVVNKIIDSEEGTYESDTKTTMYDYGFDLSVRPFMGSFRIDAGIRMMDYRVKLHGASVVTNEQNIYYAYTGDNEFVIAKGVKPYVGVGFDFNPVAGLVIGFDAGVIYTGKWKATSIDPQLDTRGATQEQIDWVENHRPYGVECAYNDIRNMEKQPNDVLSGGVGKIAQFWPVFKFNLGYKFNI